MQSGAHAGTNYLGGFFDLFFTFFVRSAFFAGVAELLEFNFTLNRLTIFGRIVIDVFALGAAQFDEMVL